MCAFDQDRRRLHPGHPVRSSAQERKPQAPMPKHIIRPHNPVFAESSNCISADEDPLQRPKSCSRFKGGNCRYWNVRPHSLPAESHSFVGMAIGKQLPNQTKKHRKATSESKVLFTYTLFRFRHSFHSSACSGLDCVVGAKHNSNPQMARVSRCLNLTIFLRKLQCSKLARRPLKKKKRTLVKAERNRNLLPGTAYSKSMRASATDKPKPERYDRCFLGDLLSSTTSHLIPLSSSFSDTSLRIQFHQCLSTSTRVVRKLTCQTTPVHLGLNALTHPLLSNRTLPATEIPRCRPVSGRKYVPKHA